jgi:hypothetical protein
MQANGITSMLFPRDKDWLRINPPWSLRKNKMAQKQYREAGEAVLHYLRASNFHHVNHGVITARSGDGTGCMRMSWEPEDDGTESMNFKRFNTMSYYIDDGLRGKVDTFAVEYDWSAHRAAQEWGIENLSPKLQSEARDPKRKGNLHKFILLIEKRSDWEKKGKSGNKAMPYAHIVVERATKKLVLNSGQEVFDVVASRYETFDSPWGYSPGWEVLPNGYKANYAAKFMMVMGERAAVPPILAPASMKEEGIGLGAAEVTYVSDLDPKSWPRELTGSGNYQIGMDVWKRCTDAIDEAYHGNLFNMFGRLDREITATETNAMRGELNAQVDPTITALNQDHTDPVVTWAFNSLAERGMINLPEEAYNVKTGKPLTPQFTYDNTLTMTHDEGRALKGMEIVNWFATLAAQGIPVDIAKIEEVGRRIWRDNGQNEDELYSEDEYQANEQAKAQAQQEAQAMEQAEKAASTGKDAAAAGLDVPGMLGQ